MKCFKFCVIEDNFTFSYSCIWHANKSNVKDSRMRATNMTIGMVIGTKIRKFNWLTPIKITDYLYCIAITACENGGGCLRTRASSLQKFKVEDSYEIAPKTFICFQVNFL